MKSFTFLAIIFIIFEAYSSVGFLQWLGFLAKSKVKNRPVAEELFKLLNDYRIQNNLPKVNWDEGIYDLSIDHSEYQRNRETISHDEFESRFKKWGTAVENVGYVKNLPESIIAQTLFDNFKKSPGHNKNMLKDFGIQKVYGAIGIINNKGNTLYYCSMHLATKKKNEKPESRSCFSFI
jgi:uncharacterized protein YkwD